MSLSDLGYHALHAGADPLAGLCRWDLREPATAGPAAEFPPKRAVFCFTRGSADHRASAGRYRKIEQAKEKISSAPVDGT